VELRDGEILLAEPDGIVGYVSVPLWKWREETAFA
jgi:hypothetical protein